MSQPIITTCDGKKLYATEINKRIKDNLNPLYSICIYMDAVYNNFVEVSIEKEKTCFVDGCRMIMRGDSLISFDCEIGKWLDVDKAINLKAFLSDLEAHQHGMGNVMLKAYFEDWNDASRLFEEAESSLSDASWIDNNIQSRIRKRIAESQPYEDMVNGFFGEILKNDGEIAKSILHGKAFKYDKADCNVSFVDDNRFTRDKDDVWKSLSTMSGYRGHHQYRCLGCYGDFDKKSQLEKHQEQHVKRGVYKLTMNYHEMLCHDGIKMSLKRNCIICDCFRRNSFDGFIPIVTFANRHEKFSDLEFFDRSISFENVFKRLLFRNLQGMGYSDFTLNMDKWFNDVSVFFENASDASEAFSKFRDLLLMLHKEKLCKTIDELNEHKKSIEETMLKGVPKYFKMLRERMDDFKKMVEDGCTVGAGFENAEVMEIMQKTSKGKETRSKIYDSLEDFVSDWLN